MSKCVGVKNRLLPYVEGALSEVEQKSVGEHLRTCTSCSKEVEALQSTVKTLRDTELPAMAPASDLRSRVMADVAHEPVRRTWWMGRTQAWSAAAAVLVLFAVVFLVVKPEVFTGGAKLERTARKMPTLTAPGALQEKEQTGDSIAAAPRAALRQERVDSPPSLPGAALKAKSVHVAPKAEETMAGKGGATGGTAGVAVRTHTFSIEPPVSAPSTGGYSSGYQAQTRGQQTILPQQARPFEDASQASEGRDQRKGGLAYGEKLAASDRVGGEGETKPPTAPAPAAIPLNVAYDNTNISNQAPAGAGGGVVQPRSKTDLRILELEKKLKDSPKNEAVLKELLNVYRNAGRTKDAYAMTERLTELQPKNPEYWFIRAQLAEAVNMPRVAKSCYRQAIHYHLSGAKLDLANGRLALLESTSQTVRQHTITAPSETPNP